MSLLRTRLRAGRLVAFTFVVIALGCGQKAGTPAPIVVTEHVSQTPGEIELSDPKVTLLEPSLVQFEVKYRFTKGKPDKYYMCDITFPGTLNHGVKPMEHWELKAEGVIRDKVELSKPGVKTFEIQMSETAAQQEPYRKISNVVSGQVQ
jgi:hypothetical protein